MIQITNSGLIESIKAVAGQDFDSYGCRVRNPRITARQSIEIADYIVELEQERNELAAQVERLRKFIMDQTSQPECCHRPDGDPETGPICCGSPDFTWPDDVVAVLSETPSAALEALKAQWKSEAVDCCEKEVTASVNVLLKPHIAGVFAVIRQRTQEPR